MPDAAAAPAAHRRSGVLLGAGAGLVVAVIVFVPVVFLVRRWLALPELPATPSHLRAHPFVVPASYWITWILAVAVLLFPAAVLTVWRATRGVALGYTLVAGLVGGSLAALTIGFELGGFAPT